MQERDRDLQAFLDSLRAAFAVAAVPGTAAHRTAALIFGALETPETAGTVKPACQPAGVHLKAAVQNARAASDGVASHAAAIGTLAPRLAWARRNGAEREGEPFASGHANATAVGPGGLEERDDVRVGISLLAPNVVYPDHRHPPEEIYLVVSPGAWRQEDGPWHEPGIGGIVHNPPGIVHAMRSAQSPLLATWCLWNPSGHA